MAGQRSHLKLVTTEGRNTAIGLARTPLGSGADAQIFPITGHGDSVAKIYHDPDKDPRRPDKIRAMLANPPDLPEIGRGLSSYVQIAWPTGMIEDRRGRFVGYAMPLVDLKRSTILENLLARKTRQVMGLPEFYGFRVVAAANLAAVVTALHRCGHHIIDLKPVNLNVYLDKFYVALLDCDGLSIRSREGKRFIAHQYTDGYIAPEALRGRKRPQELGEDQDRFALAVTLFQLLNQGIHPYQGAPRNGADVPTTNSGRIMDNLYAYGRSSNRLLAPTPWSIHAFLEDDTRALFDRAFGLRAGTRPSADEWRRHLQALADPDTGRLKKCDREAGHGMFTKGCGFCHVEGIARQAVVRKTEPRDNATRAAGKKKTRKKRTAQAPGQSKRRRGNPRRKAVPAAAHGRRPAATGRRGASSPRKSLLRKYRFAVGGLVGLILVTIFYTVWFDIHNVIRRNDQKTFFKRALREEIDWRQLTMEDARNAMGPDQERMFCAIVRNLESVPYDYGVFNYLLDEYLIQSAQAYVECMDEIEFRYAGLRRMIGTGSTDLMATLKKRLVSDQDTKYLYAEVFLRRDPEIVRQILQWGADPDMTIAVDNFQSIVERGRTWTSFGQKENNHRYHVVEKLYADRRWVPRFGVDDLRGYAPAVASICRRYSGPYKIPGIRRVRQLEMAEKRFRTMERYTPDFVSRQFGRPTKGLMHYVNPLTIAVLHADLETIGLLVAAGASLSGTVPGHNAIFDLAPNAEVYRALKARNDASDPLEQALAADDPRALAAALKKAEKANNRIFQRDVWLRTLEAGSLRCFHMLRQRWKKPYAISPVASTIKAYRSGNPRLLAYHLEHVLPYRRVFTYKQIKQRYGPLWRKSGNYEKYAFLDPFVTRKILKMEIGDILHRMAEEDSAWAMAFVLDDHASKWSDLHLAVVTENEKRIISLLKKAPRRIDRRDAKGRTALALAAQYQCDNSYDALLWFKPDLDAADKNGVPPIVHAIGYGNLLMVHNLLNKGASLEDSHKCKAAVWESLLTRALVSRISRKKDRGVPKTLSEYIDRILATHGLVEDAARKAGLPTFWPSR